jgi:hypothetical protein
MAVGERRVPLAAGPPREVAPAYGARPRDPRGGQQDGRPLRLANALDSGPPAEGEGRPRARGVGLGAGGGRGEA